MDSVGANEMDQALLAEGGAAGALVSLKEVIFDRFVERVRDALGVGGRVSRPLIVNTLPTFVSALALALSPTHARRLATDGSSVARTHGEDRAELTGYELDDLIHEYQVLRGVLFDVLYTEIALSQRDVAIINESVDCAIREATSAFVEVYDDLRSRLAATLTHDLRGPLGAASNYIHLIERAGASSADAARYCQGALRNLNRVRQMIDDLLDQSRVRAGETLHLRFEASELRAMVDEVLTDLRAAHGDRFRFTPSETIEGVWCSDALKRALTNLLENAVKYGGRSMPVTVTLSELQGNVYIAVHNEGPVIPEAQRENLFAHFRRGSEDSQGWGLGLAGVKEIAAAHGGSVSVESTAEEGTTFTLQLFRDARRFSLETTRSK
ncbi:MAG: HAMP domain-containing sensor histidine kinase [Steroidobacteraceae bacterium]